VLATARDRNAIPYDRADVELTHVATVQFRSFLRKYGLDDPALAELAVICARLADTARPELAPQAAGLLAISLGSPTTIATTTRC